MRRAVVSKERREPIMLMIITQTECCYCCENVLHTLIDDLKKMQNSDDVLLFYMLMDSEFIFRIFKKNLIKQQWSP